MRKIQKQKQGRKYIQKQSSQRKDAKKYITIARKYVWEYVFECVYSVSVEYSQKGMKEADKGTKKNGFQY